MQLQFFPCVLTFKVRGHTAQLIPVKPTNVKREVLKVHEKTRVVGYIQNSIIINNITTSPDEDG